ncbi:helix-turn-helix transcriptional regulator [Streptomyces sp. MUM 203J]|nr:helix-turn-helix transcriptional regulator [Streptomyces sp. MUM 203J]
MRKLREQAGLTSTGAAQRLGINQARVSSIESGRYAVSAERVRAFARSYDCSDLALIDALCAMTGGRTRGWWDEYCDYLPAALNDLAELEHHATRLQVALVIHIPALLQTAEHARALFKGVAPALLPYEIEHRISHRIKRQEILYGSHPIPYSALIHEAALRVDCGGREVARAQLRHIIDMSERDNVTVRVMPFGCGAFPSTGQPIDYVYGPVRKLDTVQVDTHFGCQFHDAEAQLAKFRHTLDELEAISLDPAESRDFIDKLMREI